MSKTLLTMIIRNHFGNKEVPTVSLEVYQVIMDCHSSKLLYCDQVRRILSDLGMKEDTY